MGRIVRRSSEVARSWFERLRRGSKAETGAEEGYGSRSREMRLWRKVVRRRSLCTWGGFKRRESPEREVVRVQYILCVGQLIFVETGRAAKTDFMI